jgi:hypothetical protein
LGNAELGLLLFALFPHIGGSLFPNGVLLLYIKMDIAAHYLFLLSPAAARLAGLSTL